MVLLKKRRYCVAKSAVSVWKVFMNCPIHGVLESPFFYQPLKAIIDKPLKRIGYFAFLSLASAEKFKLKLEKKRPKCKFQILCLFIPKGQKYRMGYLPAGCHSAGMKCVAANSLRRG